MSTKHEIDGVIPDRKSLFLFEIGKLLTAIQGSGNRVCELQTPLEINYNCIFSTFLVGKSRTNVDTFRREVRWMTHNAVFVLTLTCRPEPTNRILQRQVWAFVLSSWRRFANGTVRAVSLTSLKSLSYLPDTLLTAKVGTL
jgi:hypothetical protein